MRMRLLATTSIASVLTVLVAGCSTKGEDDSGSGDGGSLKTDVGVTDDAIKLGVLTDTSGPFKSAGLSALYGHQIWAEEVNEAGGICDR